MTSEDRLVELLEKWEERTAENAAASTVQEFCERHNAADIADEFRKLIDRLGLLGDVFAEKTAECEVTSIFPAKVDAGRYRAQTFHAKGGLGVVYRAEDQELHRNVALKCMQQIAATDSSSRERFLLEAEITGKLEHPGVVPVYGLGTDRNGSPYYAMRFIEGQDLRQAIDAFHTSNASDVSARNVELRRLLRHFIAVCETMAYAHSRRVIHRDLKPANVMIGPYGETLVVDWGLAKRLNLQAADEADTGPDPLRLVLNDSIDATVQGYTKGSPAFMSPEQACGEWDRVGSASDIYSLGATLYDLLSGKRPYEGKSAREVVEKVQVGACIPLRVAYPNVARPLEAVCGKAMAFHPEERYADAKDLAADLERWLADEPVSAWREPFSVRSRRWLRRHRTLVAGAFATFLIGVFAAVALAVQDRRSAEREAGHQKQNAEQEKQNAEEQAHLRQREEEAKNEAIVQRNKAEDNRRLVVKTLYTAVMNIVARSMEEGKLDRARQLLREAMPRPGDEADHRGFEWYYAWRELQYPSEVAFQIPANPDRMELSADGSILAALCGAFSGKNTQHVVCRVADGKTLLTLPATFASRFSLSASGRYLAINKGKNIELWRLAEKPFLERTLTGFQTYASDVVVSNDDEWVVAAGDFGQVRGWKLGTGEGLFTIDDFRVANAKTGGTYALSMSPDRRWLCFYSKSAGGEGLRRPVLMALTDKGPKRVDFPAIPPKTALSNAVGFTQTGCLYAVTITEKEIWTWPLPEVKNEPKPIDSAEVRRFTPLFGTDERSDLLEIPHNNNERIVLIKGFKTLTAQRSGMKTSDTSVEGELGTIPIKTGPLESSFELPEHPAAFAFALNGKSYARVDRSGRVVVERTDKLFEHKSDARHGPDSYSRIFSGGLSFTEDGQLLSYSGWGRLILAQPGAGQGRSNLSESQFKKGNPDRSTVRHVAISRDARWLALRVGDQTRFIEPSSDRAFITLSVPCKQAAAFDLDKFTASFVPSTNLYAAVGQLAKRKPEDSKKPHPSSLFLWDVGRAVQARAAFVALGGSLVFDTFARNAESLLHIVDLPNSAEALAVSADGGFLAVGDDEGCVRVWPVDEIGKSDPRIWNVGSAVRAIDFDPTGNRLAVGCLDGSVWTWSLDGSEPLLQIQALKGNVVGVQFASRSGTIVAASKGGRLIFLTRDLPNESFSIRADIGLLTISPEHRLIAGLTEQGRITYFRTATAFEVLEGV